MKKYFLHNGTEQSGPFDLEDLKAKSITRETPIWYEGLEEWSTAGKIDELKSLFLSVPPPYGFKATPPPLQKNENKAETFYEPKKKKGNLGRYVLIFLIGFVVLFITAQIIRKSKDTSQSYEEKVMTVEEIEKSEPTNFLTASGNYNQNIWGTKLKVHGIITNKATVATYKDAVVKVIYYSKTNTELGNKEYTIYESFPPNSDVNFELKIGNYENVNSIGWEVVSAKTF